MRWGLAVLLLSAGCTDIQRLTNRPSPERQSPEDWFNAKWTGQSEDDVKVHYGDEYRRIDLSTNNYVLSFHNEVSFAESRSAYSAYGGGSKSLGTTVYCDRRFEIDKDTHIVVRAVITGSKCDYAR